MIGTKTSASDELAAEIEKFIISNVKVVRYDKENSTFWWEMDTDQDQVGEVSQSSGNIWK